MANIFTLADSADDIQEKIDIDDLYERKRQADINSHELFNKMLNKIHQRIKKTTIMDKNATHCWYIIPEVILGIAKYDQGECIGYIVEKLRENGFNLRYFHPNTILVSWGHWVPSYVRDVIKQKTKQTVDSFGNVTEDKPSQSNDIIDEMFNVENKQTAINKKAKEFKSMDSYKPSGKFIYNTDFFKKS